MTRDEFDEYLGLALEYVKEAEAAADINERMMHRMRDERDEARERVEELETEVLQLREQIDRFTKKAESRTWLPPAV